MYRLAWVIKGWKYTAYKPGYYDEGLGDGCKWHADVSKATHYDTEAKALATVAELRDRPRSLWGRFEVIKRIVS